MSIGLPVYNGEASLRQALDCLLAQDYPNIELIISDNASTDGTQEICRRYQLTDRRVSYFRNSINIGAPANFNRVFNLAHGEYFMWAAHDDYRKPNYISSCVNALQESDRIVLVGTWCDCLTPDDDLMLVDKSLSTIGMSPVQRFMRYKRILHEYNTHRGGILYGLFRRDTLSRVMPLQTMMTTDQNMMLQLCLLGEFVTVPERLLTRRMSGPSNTGSLMRLARSYGITNPFLIYGAYITREIEIWKIIARAKLNLVAKMWLVIWSLCHTIMAVCLRVLSLGYQRVKR